MSEDFEKLLAPPTMRVPDAGKILGMAPNAAYRAAKSGDIPTIRVGGKIIVPTAKLRAMLGLPPHGAAPIAA